MDRNRLRRQPTLALSVRLRPRGTRFWSKFDQRPFSQLRMPPRKFAFGETKSVPPSFESFDKKRCLMTHELAVSLRDEIIQRHREGIALDHLLRDTLLKKLECTRATGILLEEAHEQFHGHRWHEFETSLPFDSKALRAYIRFARRHPGPVTDVLAAMRCAKESAMLTGLLPWPNGHGPETLHKPNFFSRVTNTLQDIAAEWRKFVDRKPLSNWPDKTKEQFLSSLKPLLQIYKEVAATLK
jgi:hypothetical protein